MAASHTHPVPATFTDEEISALYEAGLHEPNTYGVWWVVCPHCHQRLYNISKEKFAREHCWAYIDKKGQCKVDPRDLELPPAARAAAIHANLQAAAPASSSSSSSSSRGHSSSIHGEDSMTSSKRRRIESPSQAVSDASPGRGAQHGESAGHPVQAADSNSEEHSSAAPAGEDGGALDTASEHTWDGGVSSDTDEDAAEEGAEQPGQPAAGVDVLADFEYDGDAAGDAADLQRLRAAAAELAAVLTTPEPHTLSPHSPKLLTAYRERLNQPLYDGCPKPLRYWVVHWMQLLLQGGVNRATFDQMLHAERTGHKQPNLVPPSSHMLKRIVGLKPLSAYEWHVCSCGKHAWQPLDSAQWPSAHFLSQPEQQRGEQPRRLADVPTEQHSCPQCKAPRFQQHVQPGDMGWVSYTPYARCYYLGLEEALLRPCFASPEFCAAVGTGRKASDPSSFWASSGFRDLNARLGNILTQPSNSRHLPHKAYTISIAADFGQPFNSRARSTGVVAVRFEDLPDHLRAKQPFHAIVMLIPPVMGKEPECLDGFLLPLLWDLQRYGPPALPNDPLYKAALESSWCLPAEEIGQGVTVWPTATIPPAVAPGDLQPVAGHRHADTCQVTRVGSCKIHLVVVGFHADLPMRNKLMRCASHTAFLHCPFCTTNAITVYGKPRSMGYAARRAIHVGPNERDTFLMTVDGPVSVDGRNNFYKGEDQIRDDAEAAQIALDTEGHDDVKAYTGMVGQCAALQLLWYLQYTTAFFVPLGHTFYRGVLRNFVLLVIPQPYQQASKSHKREHGMPAATFPKALQVPLSVRRIMSGRSKLLVLTSDFSKPVADATEKLRTYTMEELFRLLEVDLPLLWAGVPGIPTKTKQAFGHLRRFALWHMSPPAQRQGESVEAYEERLQQGLHDSISELVEYAKLAEKEFCVKMMTPNLHLLLCQLRKQCERWGNTYQYLELWGERMIQVYKRLARNRATSDPEKVVTLLLAAAAAVKELALSPDLWQVVQGALDEEFAGAVRGAVGDGIVDGDDEALALVGQLLQNEQAMAEEAANLFDQPLAGLHSPNVLLGRGVGKTADDDVVEPVLRALAGRQPGQLPGGWEPEDLHAGGHEALHVFVHQRADVNGRTITSQLYTRERTRDNKCVAVCLPHIHDGGDGEAPAVAVAAAAAAGVDVCIGRVAYFVRVWHHYRDIPLRAAVVDLFGFKAPIVDHDLGTIYRGTGAAGQGGRAVCLLTEIRGKVCYTREHAAGDRLFCMYA